MKKNILGAIVIFFVTFACLLVITELSNSKDVSSIETTEFYAEEQ